MNNEELLEEARAYFAQLERPSEELNVRTVSDYILNNQKAKDNLEKNGNRVILLDTVNGKKRAFLLMPNMRSNHFELARIKETTNCSLFETVDNNVVQEFTSHKQFFPNLTLEQQHEITGSIVKLKDGTYATITNKKEVIQ